MDAVFRNIGIIVCGLGGGLLCIAIVGFLIGCIFTYGLRLNSRERYEVIIDNKSIDFSEFNEKYKAIEVRGKIYTIEERNPCSNYGAKMEQEAR